jgi:hypothetical protein
MPARFDRLTGINRGFDPQVGAINLVAHYFGLCFINALVWCDERLRRVADFL